MDQCDASLVPRPINADVRQTSWTRQASDVRSTRRSQIGPMTQAQPGERVSRRLPCKFRLRLPSLVWECTGKDQSTHHIALCLHTR